MSFAKFFPKLTACVAAFVLAACVNPQSELADFNRTEAVKARIDLALAYLQQNDFPKAKQNIDKALAHDPHHYLPHSVLAYYYQQVGEPQNAETAYQKALALSQRHSQDNHPIAHILNNYGTFLCKQGKFNEAYQQFEQALNRDQPYYHQADTLENMVICADSAKHIALRNQAISQLEKLDPTRAAKWK